MAYRPTDRTRARAAAARERIVSAALDQLAEGGYASASMAAVARRAGVATGSVYRHFDSKAHLYAQVLAMVSEREVDVMREIVDSHGPATQRLVDAIFVFSLRALRGRRLAYALIAEPCEPEIDRARLVYRAALAGQVARLIREGIGAGEFVAADVAVAASCVTGAFMEALVGPLSPEATPEGAAARTLARTIASLSARLVFRQAPPKLSLVSRGLQ